MLFEDLFQKILIEPAEDGATELMIVSGYATASMADRHLRKLAERLDNEIRIQLVYGMAFSDGVSLTDDSMFKRLESEFSFSCFYQVEPFPVHSKVYVWLLDGKPQNAFVGSANYTQGGFLGNYKYREVMAEVNPYIAFDYCSRILNGSLEITHDDIEGRITIVDPLSEQVQRSMDSVNLSLISQGEVPDRSGLNWGQRPGRDHDQAYIPIPQRIARAGFFPERTVRFTVCTDDGISFIGTVAQDNNKALHSTEDNTIIGRYFRRRLGVESGVKVVKEHLDNYGRTDVTFWKIDDETFYMDFSI